MNQPFSDQNFSHSTPSCSLGIIAHGPHGWDVICDDSSTFLASEGGTAPTHTWAYLQHPAPFGVTRPSPAANPRCPDVVLVTSVLNACGRAAYVDRAILLFEDMRRWSIDPSPVSYAAVINACAKCGWMVDKPCSFLILDLLLITQNSPFCVLFLCILMTTKNPSLSYLVCFSSRFLGTLGVPMLRRAHLVIGEVYKRSLVSC